MCTARSVRNKSLWLIVHGTLDLKHKAQSHSSCCAVNLSCSFYVSFLVGINSWDILSLINKYLTEIRLKPLNPQAKNL